MSDAGDQDLLLRATLEGRVLLTHDESTMPGHYFELINRGEALEGVFIVPRRLSIRRAIEDLELVIDCSSHDDWKNDYKILPL